MFNLSHAYRKKFYFDHAAVCLERCLALKESSSAYAALAFCLHTHAMALPLDRKEDTNALLHRAIDTYHQSLAKKPDNAFSSEMLSKALGDALEQTDFFVSDQENNVSGDNLHGMPGLSTSASRNSAGARGNPSSIWTDDGLSLSVESASDIDMA